MLIQKKAIVEVDDFSSLCLSPIFVIPKMSGDLRVILNLTKMNVFIPVQHFRMETLNVILEDLRSHVWAVSIDLKDAYLHVPIHPQSRRLVGFKFLDKTYTYKVLPFGLKDSPWVFSRIVATVIGHLRLQGIIIFFYLDDLLLVAESSASPRVSPTNHSSVVSKVGFHRQLEEVDAHPSESAGGSSGTHSGANCLLGSSCSPVAEVSRPFDQSRRSGPELQASHETCSVALPSILYSSVGPSVEDDSFDSGCQGFVCSLGISGSSAEKGNPFSPPPPSPLHVLVLTSDASRSGWGATLPPHRVSGVWSQEESLDHINSLELRAIFLAINCLEVHVRGKSLLVRTDNTTVVSYINCQGGTHCHSLCRLAIELWEWCLLRGIHLLAAHIPGGGGELVADFLSRGKFLPT